MSAITQLFVHIDALVLIPSTGFKENFLRFLGINHEWTRIDESEKERTTTDDTDFTNLGSARGSRAGFGGLAKTIFFKRQHKRFLIRKAGTQESRKGISNREGKAVKGGSERGGSRASFNRGKGFSR